MVSLEQNHHSLGLETSGNCFCVWLHAHIFTSLSLCLSFSCFIIFFVLCVCDGIKRNTQFSLQNLIRVGKTGSRTLPAVWQEDL